MGKALASEEARLGFNTTAPVERSAKTRPQLQVLGVTCGTRRKEEVSLGETLFPAT